AMVSKGISHSCAGEVFGSHSVQVSVRDGLSILLREDKINIIWWYNLKIVFSYCLRRLFASEEQIHEECRAMKEPMPTESFKWGIISIKGTIVASFSCLCDFLLLIRFHFNFNFIIHGCKHSSRRLPRF